METRPKPVEGLLVEPFARRVFNPSLPNLGISPGRTEFHVWAPARYWSSFSVKSITPGHPPIQHTFPRDCIYAKSSCAQPRHGRPMHWSCKTLYIQTTCIHRIDCVALSLLFMLAVLLQCQCVVKVVFGVLPCTIHAQSRISLPFFAW